jgi:hypothetical protein
LTGRLVVVGAGLGDFVAGGRRGLAFVVVGRDVGTTTPGGLGLTRSPIPASSPLPVRDGAPVAFAFVVGSSAPSVGITMSPVSVVAAVGWFVPSAICSDGVPLSPALKLPVKYRTGTASAIAAPAPPTTGRRSRRERGARCLPT